MTTLISLHGFSAPPGRCDANCYDATSDVCTCICGGRNHGSGLHQAIAQTKQWAHDLIAELQTPTTTVHFHPSIAQMHIAEVLDD